MLCFVFRSASEKTKHKRMTTFEHCVSPCVKGRPHCSGRGNESPFRVASAPQLGIIVVLVHHDAVKVLCPRDRITDRCDAPTARVL